MHILNTKGVKPLLEEKDGQETLKMLKDRY
jgi:hypothetical protein